MGLASQTATGLVNNALARVPAQEQRDWQEKMWHQQNAYNTPSAMAGRMRAAGLNPYALTGAEPAGSAGSGTKADFIPLQDPLSVTRQIADIENIRAATGKTLSETEKLIQEASNLQLALEKGLIEKEEYEFRFNKLKEAWNESNPYKLENENKAADTALKKAQTASTQVDADNKQRKYDDEHAIAVFEAATKSIAYQIESETKQFQIDSRKSQSEMLKEDLDILRKTKEHNVNLAEFEARLKAISVDISSHSLNYENYMRNFRDLVGFDPRTLPPALQAHLLYNFNILAEETEENGFTSMASYKSFRDDMISAIQYYIEHEAHIPISESENFSLTVLGTGISHGTSSTF